MYSLSHDENGLAYPSLRRILRPADAWPIAS
jgi:hypothetical protein